MRRYYFHVKQGDDMLADEEGDEFPDLDAVRECALLSARQLFGDEIKDGKPFEDQTVIVKDDAGETVMTISFKDVAAAAK